MSKFKKMAMLAGLGLVAAAVVQELRKPAGSREWHGRIGGLVPYEFRPPTPRRLRDALWAPEDERVFTDTAFGVGWSVNLARVAKIAGSKIAA